MNERETALTGALAAFDRHVPLFLGAVPKHPEFSIDWLDVGMTAEGRHGRNRHSRMLHDREFDIAEVSLSSFIIQKQQRPGLTGVPVFPRRLFTPPALYVRSDGDFQQPADLAGKRIAVRGFQVTMSVQAKGDLARDYGLPWQSVHWFTKDSEAIALAARDGVQINEIPDGETVESLFVDGKIDALIDPFPSPSLLAKGIVRRLFADPTAASEDYFQRRGYFPIMHILAVRDERLEQFPGLGNYLVASWEAAKREAGRVYDDPAYSLFPVARPFIEDQRRRFGEDPWPSGFNQNLENIEDFIGYLFDQGLIDNKVSPESLFHPSTL